MIPTFRGDGTFARAERFRPDDQGAFVMATPSAYAPSASATNGTMPADVERQIATLRGDISKLTQDVADLVSLAKEDTMAQVKSQVRSAKAQVDSALSDASDKGREAVDAFRDVADTFGDAVDDSLKRRPYATLAIVAGIGFLLGAVWRS
jgi:ElaB/YqjD/DUF883 family membrane-anchored ribosome-binding protein